MSDQPPSPQRPSIFSQIDVSSVVSTQDSMSEESIGEQHFHDAVIKFQHAIISQQKLILAQQQRQHSEMMSFVRDMAANQRRQTDLLAQMVNMQTAPARQRAQELQQWRANHPKLARECRAAIDILGKIQSEYYGKMVEEIDSNGDSLEYGDYMINEFLDRFGPRLVHMNSLLQMLSQLAAPPEEEA